MHNADFKVEYLSKLVVKLVRHGKAVQQVQSTSSYRVHHGLVLCGRRGAGLSAIGMVTRHPSVDVAVNVGANP